MSPLESWTGRWPLIISLGSQAMSGLGAMPRSFQENNLNGANSSLSPSKRFQPMVKNITLQAHISLIATAVGPSISHVDPLTLRRTSQTPEKEWTWREPPRGDSQTLGHAGPRAGRKVPDCPAKGGHRPSLLPHTTRVSVNNIGQPQTRKLKDCFFATIRPAALTIVWG